jgi:predicted dehydrogenase
MLSSEARDTDIVLVCTPPSFHAAFVVMALASNRHVLCEKPLFFDAKEVGAIQRQLAARGGLMLACCSNRFVGRSSIAKARELISQGRIGMVNRIRWMERKNRSRSGIEYLPNSRWFLNRKQSGGGVTMDWGPYDLAALDAILHPRRVTVRSSFMTQVETGVMLEPGTVFDVETQVIAQMDYELADGSLIKVDYERASATHGREESVFEFEGSRGAIDLEWIWNDKIQIRLDSKGSLTSEELELEPENASVHERPIREMMRAVRGESSLTIFNDDALFNFRCLRALFDAAESGGTVSVERQAMIHNGGCQ